MKFDENGLIPLIIQDSKTGQILSLFYANKEAVEKIKQTGYVWRYSRKYKKLMQKGETSSNTQKVILLKEDCDNDALIALVETNGPACHTGKESCFETPKFNSFLTTLEEIIQNRKINPKKESYTNQLLNNNELLKEKLREELEEFINYNDKENLIWEASDLLYFMLVYLAKNNVKLNEIEKHLANRNNNKK